MFDVVTCIGFVAGFLTTAAFLPQVFKIWRDRSTHDISLLTFGVFSLGVFLWLAYGLMIQSFPIIVSNMITFFLAMIIVIFKVRFG